MAKIPTCLYHMTPFDQRPIVTVLVRGLNLPQRMAESVFSKAFKVITGAVEGWRPKVDGVARSTSDAELLRDIGLASERADATALRTHIADFGLIDHAGTYGHGVVQSDGGGFHRLGEVPNGHHVVV